MDEIIQKRSFILEVLKRIIKDLKYLKKNLKRGDCYQTSFDIISDLNDAISSIKLIEKVRNESIVYFRAEMNLEIFSVVLEELLNNSNYDELILNNLNLVKHRNAISKLDGPLKLMIKKDMVDGLDLKYPK